MSHIVTASVFYYVEDGRRVRYSRGDTITVADSEVARLLRIGAITDKTRHAAPTAPAPSRDTPPPAAPPPAAAPAPAPTVVELERPAKAAAHEKWVEYVAAALGRPAEEFVELTKPELQAIEV